MSGLQSVVRPASGDPEGAVVLLHGRAADEHDLHPLLDAIDPNRRLVGVTPRGPLALAPGGAHWYAVRDIGFPDPETFWAGFGALTSWLDAFLVEHGIDHSRLILGGFSQGAVMSYAATLAAGRARPAALLALSGFIPTVEGLEIDASVAEALPVLIGHGTSDAVIGVEWGRRAREQMSAAGATLEYREAPMAHTIEPALIERLAPWAAGALGPRPEA